MLILLVILFIYFLAKNLKKKLYIVNHENLTIVVRTTNKDGKYVKANVSHFF